MRTSIFSITGALLAALLLPSQIVCAGNETQNILINDELRVPGAVLARGRYVLSVADHLYDRTIVKISRADRRELYRVLAVQNADAKDNAGGSLTFFRQSDEGKAALKAWGSLEFVYPKAEALKITADSGQTVLAIDPAADKLPVKMSQEDMKVVTLWSLTPKKVTADNRGVGVTAVKYASASDSSATVAPAASPAVPVHPPNAAGRQLPKKLPKTASDNYTYLLYGSVLLSLAAGFRTLRVRQVVRL